MAIDWIYVICLAIFLFRGYRKGVILAVFSIIALLAGMAAALKLSGTVAGWLFAPQPRLAWWAPLLVYLLVFFVVAFLVRIVGKVLQKSMEIVALGWFNRLSGALIYGLVWSMIVSVLLWLLTQMAVLSPETIASSHTYPWLVSLAPEVMAFIGNIIPVLKEGFEELGNLFDNVNQQLTEHVGTY